MRMCASKLVVLRVAERALPGLGGAERVWSAGGWRGGALPEAMQRDCSSWDMGSVELAEWGWSDAFAWQL
jgi:hypothetical protein